MIKWGNNEPDIITETANNSDIDRREIRKLYNKLIEKGLDAETIFHELEKEELQDFSSVGTENPELRNRLGLSKCDFPDKMDTKKYTDMWVDYMKEDNRKVANNSFKPDFETIKTIDNTPVKILDNETIKLYTKVNKFHKKYKRTLEPTLLKKILCKFKKVNRFLITRQARLLSRSRGIKTEATLSILNDYYETWYTEKIGGITE